MIFIEADLPLMQQLISLHYHVQKQINVENNAMLKIDLNVDRFSAQELCSRDSSVPVKHFV